MYWNTSGFLPLKESMIDNLVVIATYLNKEKQFLIRSPPLTKLIKLSSCKKTPEIMHSDMELGHNGMEWRPARM